MGVHIERRRNLTMAEPLAHHRYAHATVNQDRSRRMSLLMEGGFRQFIPFANPLKTPGYRLWMELPFSWMNTKSVSFHISAFALRYKLHCFLHVFSITIVSAGSLIKRTESSVLGVTHTHHSWNRKANCS